MKAKKHVQKGKHLQRSRVIRTNARFRRPKTLSLPRQPRFQRKSVPHRNRYVSTNHYSTTLTTRSTMLFNYDDNSFKNHDIKWFESIRTVWIYNLFKKNMFMMTLLTNMIWIFVLKWYPSIRTVWIRVFKRIALVVLENSGK